MKPTRGQPGFYPGYHTLDQQDAWDETTRKLIQTRIHAPKDLRFFSPTEARLMKAVLDRIIPQDDRDEEHKIDLLSGIDHRLAAGKMNGYRYDDMPPDEEAHRMGLEGIEGIARHLFSRSFLDLTNLEKDRVLLTIHDARPPAGEVWRKMPADRYWSLLIEDATKVYYAHPYAWDEIGFGGPAYPRGYMRLHRGEPEPWEKPERRYRFQAPADSLSGVATKAGKLEHPYKP